MIFPYTTLFRSEEDVVKYADISLNTELATLHDLSAEAQRQGVIHKVIIMIELGDLREGVMREDLINFYEKVFRLPGIRVIGLGTNLNCLDRKSTRLNSSHVAISYAVFC